MDACHCHTEVTLDASAKEAGTSRDALELFPTKNQPGANCRVTPGMLVVVVVVVVVVVGIVVVVVVGRNVVAGAAIVVVVAMAVVVVTVAIIASVAHWIPRAER